MKRVVGLDLSLTATGIVALNEGEIVKQNVISYPKLKGWKRMNLIVGDITEFLEEVNPELVCVEGYAFGAKFNREKLGELGGIIRFNCLYLGCISYIDISPPSLKKFATGKGNCKKEIVMMKVLKEYNIEFENNNLCDAFVLAKIADALVRKVKLKNKIQEEIISKLKKDL